MGHYGDNFDCSTCDDDYLTKPGPLQVVAYHMTNSATVHVKCREKYCKTFDARSRPTFTSALHKGFKFGRFQLCEHCQKPITHA